MNYVILLGRFLFGGFFVFSGAMHFIDMSAVSGYAASKGMPMPEVAVGLSGLMLLGGGLSYVLGYQTRIGSILLVAFLLPAAFLMHTFWAEIDPVQRQTQMAFFLRNLALSGASLMLAYVSKWPISLGKK